MFHSKQAINPTAVALLLLAAGLLAAGCGVDQSPTAPTHEGLTAPEPEAVSVPGGRTFLTFSPDAAQRAAKIAAADKGDTRTSRIGPAGGGITIE